MCSNSSCREKSDSLIDNEGNTVTLILTTCDAKVVRYKHISFRVSSELSIQALTVLFG